MGFKEFKIEAQRNREEIQYNSNIGPDHVKPQAEVKTEANFAKELINQITYEIPEGMSEDVAMAVVLGSMVDDELLKDSDTSSSPGTDSKEEFRRGFMIMNAFGGDGTRANEFYFVMPKARELAKQAFEEFKNGKHDLVERYAANTIRLAGELFIGEVRDSKESNVKSFLCKCACELYNSGYAQDMVPSEVYLDKVKTRAAAQEIYNESVVQTAQLAEKLPKPGTKEREEALLNIMAVRTLLNSTPVSDQVEPVMEETMKQFFGAELKNSDKETTIYMRLAVAIQEIKKNTLYPEDYMIADPKRRQNYLTAIKEYLRTTDNFKTLLAADQETFAREFESLSTVKLSEEKQYELVGADNIEAVNQINSRYAEQQAAPMEEFLFHTKEKAEQIVRQRRERKKAPVEAEKKEALKQALLTCVKETQGLGDRAEDVDFYMTSGRVRLDGASEYMLEGEQLYLINPQNGLLLQLIPEYHEDGTISVGMREKTAYSYPTNQPIKNIRVVQYNSQLLKDITIPHEVGSIPGMEKLFFCKRQLVDAADGMDMGENYRTVIAAIEEVEQYCKELYTPESDGRYPVFGRTQEETLKQLMDSVIDKVSSYQDRNPFGIVMDDVKEAVHQGLDSINALQVDDRRLSLKARVSIQETKDLDAMMMGRTYTKEQSELETRKQLGEYLKQLETLTNGRKISENYKNYIASLKNLMDTTEPYFIPAGRNMYPLVTADDKKVILQGYGKALESTKQLLGELLAGEQKEYGELQSIVEKTREFMETDILTMEDLVVDGKTSLPDAIYNGRGQKVVLPQGVELNTLGGQLSSRIAMTYTDADGVEHQGFFTKNYTYNAREQFNKEAEKIGEKYPELKGYFDALTRLELAPNENLQTVYNFSDQLAVTPEQYGFEKGTFDEYLNHEQFEEACQELEIATNNLNTLIDLEVQNGISMGGMVPSRNTALSRMAALLGVPKLVAGSREMTFVQDKVEYKGHFMDTADGVDLSGVREGDPMTMYGEEVYDNGEGLRKMAELQVLDYICGNTDRHLQNYMYNFDTTDPEHPKFTGPVGIDNDLSFGAYVPDPDQKPGVNGVCLNSINAVSKSMADTILALQPEMIKLTLRDMGISDREMDACVARLNQVKERIQEGLAREWSSEIEIQQGTLHVIKDEDFDRLKLENLAAQTNDAFQFNRFNYLKKVTQTARANAVKNATSDLQKEAETRDVPRDVSQKEKEFFARTERVDVFNKATFEAYSKQFKDVFDRLSETEGFFHGSKQQYKAMKHALENLIQAGGEEPDTAHYQTLLNNMREAVNGYIEYKKNDLGSSTSQKRFALANELKELTGTIRKDFFDSMEAQNERDVLAVNRQIHEAVQAGEKPKEPDLSEKLFRISDSLKEKLTPAAARMREVLAMRQEERGQVERIIMEFQDVNRYEDTFDNVKNKNASDRQKALIDAFQKLYNDNCVKRTIAQQREGVNRPLQEDMLKYAAAVQKLTKKLDLSIPNEVQGVRAELASKLHAFAGKRHPDTRDTCVFIRELKETMQEHQKELEEHVNDPVYRQVTELVTNHESHFGDFELAETELYMVEGRRLEPKTFGNFLQDQQKLRNKLLPPAPKKESAQAEVNKGEPTV